MNSSDGNHSNGLHSAEGQPVVVQRVMWQEACDSLSTIRRRVFIEEQGVPPEEEWDGLDLEATHFAALCGGNLVACARLSPVGKIQRMAVLPQYRGRGIGSALFQSIIDYAAASDFPPLYLDAQTHALSFYERFGFIASGDEFLDAGIAHRRMEQNLQTATSKTAFVTPITSPGECKEYLHACLDNCHRSIDVLSEQLAPALFADEQTAQKVLQLARANPRARVRILVKDTRPLHGMSHPLVNLAQRMPSRVHLRRLNQPPADAKAGFVIGDKERLLHLKDEASYAGYYRAEARAQAEHLLTEFDHLWEHYSGEDPDLRRLSL